MDVDMCTRGVSNARVCVGFQYGARVYLTRGVGEGLVETLPPSQLNLVGEREEKERRRPYHEAGWEIISRRNLPGQGLRMMRCR